MAAILILLTASLAVPATTLATDALDQSQTNTGATTGTNASSFGQTFTAGITGLLDKVSIFPFTGYSFNGDAVQITTTSGGFPTATVIGSGTVTSSATNQFVDVTLSSPATVASGTQYALVIVPGGSTAFYSDFANYSAGNMVIYYSGAWHDVGTDLDMAFRTYVNVEVQPTITKTFGDAVIDLNGSTSLSFTLKNPADNLATLTGIAFTDTLPAGLVVSTPNGLIGSCGGGTITATAGSGTVSLSGASLAIGASCTFRLNVTATTTGLKTNSVTVSSTNGVTPANTATAILSVGPPDLTIASSHTGNFRVGHPGTYALRVTNLGPGASLGTVTVTDTLPAGLPPTSASGSGWSCSTQVVRVTCTRSNLLAPGDSFPDITLTVRPTISALGTFMNMARVAADNDANPANDITYDRTVTGF